MSRKLKLHSSPFQTHTPESFYSFVKSMIKSQDAKESKTTPNVSLSFNEAGKKTIIRIKRDPKQLTRDEITQLAVEYDKPELELLALFTAKARKIEVIYGPDDKRSVTDSFQLAKLREQAKADAKLERERKRQNSRIDKLQQP